MYNNWHGCAEYWGKEYVASNQLVGGSSSSGRTKFSMTYNVSENCTLLLDSDFQGGNQRQKFTKTIYLLPAR